MPTVSQNRKVRSASHKKKKPDGSPVLPSAKGQSRPPSQRIERARPLPSRQTVAAALYSLDRCQIDDEEKWLRVGRALWAWDRSQATLNLWACWSTRHGRGHRTIAENNGTCLAKPAAAAPSRSTTYSIGRKAAVGLRVKRAAVVSTDHKPRGGWPSNSSRQPASASRGTRLSAPFVITEENFIAGEAGDTSQCPLARSATPSSDFSGRWASASCPW